MSKPHKIKLLLPEPCKEDWDTMTPDEQGRHCVNCSKSVVDFTKFTDKELFDFFVKTKEHVCGRFNSLQLNRTIAIYEPADTSIFKRIFFGAALTAGVAGTAHSQDMVSNQTHQVQSPNDTLKKGNQITKKKHIVKNHPPKPVGPPPLMGAPARVIDEKEHDSLR